MSDTMNLNHNPLQNLAQHVASLQKRLSEMDHRLETTNDRLMNLAKASKDRFDRVQSLVASLDFAHKKSIEDLKLELSKISGQITQKRIIDTRIEEALKKHNEMASQVELRLQDLKKTLSAHDMKFSKVESWVNHIEMKQFK
ncbi:MAG: hypothetical protein H6625_01765 [Bdellovibrionaceae bacterium]|nr:hypothetical protein [Pseudobdellovibrionaceae bacterium]